MRKHFITLVLCMLFTFSVFAKDIPEIYIDKEGVMRWSDTKEEAAFYGVNYTLPFAHAYRAMTYLGIEHKRAIDRDVYHFARLGLNAYRIHIWDVEISDRQGSLISNSHLELLDYLIARLRERGIRIVITAQTNFGNGYPEHNQVTEGYSYQTEKCRVHADPQAVRAQERYLGSLVRHVNPYTQLAYKEDPYIIGFEINNEPCHLGTVSETKNYINKMLKALAKAGNKKPVFYNVSHNREVAEAYYDTDIQGTTYQWYPTGLVSGHTRRGNFLPYVDTYDIPFESIKGFHKKARLIYEFDPADLLYSYMYPAMARTFRKAGFQWITQFAYDPIDMAFANSEYQTHFLNLAYTPRKALSMKIAAEVVREVKRGEDFGCYPADTVFRHFRVSYGEDLSELNSKEKFYYSNQTTACPLAPDSLCSVAGYGNSPVVEYDGSGAYFIDKLEAGIWRLEIMPDVVQLSDPFAKPSLKKEVRRVLFNRRNLRLRLPDLGSTFYVKGIDKGNTFREEVGDGQIEGIQPGVYLLYRKGITLSDKWQAETCWQNIWLGEFVAPSKPRKEKEILLHQPVKVTEAGKDLLLQAVLIGGEQPDSILIYTNKVSFWNPVNPSVRMRPVGLYTYQAVIPAKDLTEGFFRYTMVVCRGNERRTYPADVAGSPLDWDYTEEKYWETQVAGAADPFFLFSVREGMNYLDLYMIPEKGWIKPARKENTPLEEPTISFRIEISENASAGYLRKYVREEVVSRMSYLQRCTQLCLHVKQGHERIRIGFITTDGYTYKTDCPVSPGEIVRLPLSALKQTATALLPHAYPVFLKKFFYPSVPIDFHPENIESFELSFEGGEIEIGSVWME
ncbi:hypothetical protein [Parabacteroides pacaensis]|uniref:hypothetical protein n=1 Tax=Parabacteroides pacaensis TaxID=2086575 RepID=UPI000D0EB216|nr:hypothetical protein [Parabacteroides pacaensis]